MKSQAQRRWMHATHPEMAERWEQETPKGKKLPEHVGKSMINTGDILETYKTFAKANLMPSGIEEMDDHEIVVLLKAVRTDTSPIARVIEGWLEGAYKSRTGYSEEFEDNTPTLDGFFDNTRVHATLTEPQPATHVLREEIDGLLADVLPGDLITFQKASNLGQHSPTDNIVVQSVDKVTGAVTGRTLGGRMETISRSTPLLNLSIQSNGDRAATAFDRNRIGGYLSTLDTSREF
jgi:hypothetical protein